MKFDDDYEIPEGDFIPGIYNYCNSWCERCLYTEKCMNFAMEKTFRKEIEAQKRREKSMEENKNFWAQVNKSVEEAAELIDEEIPLVKNEWDSMFDDWDDEDAEEAMKDHKAQREKAKGQQISQISSKYEMGVYQWLEDRKEILKQDYDPDTKDFNISYPGIENEAELKQLTESVEVILWYHIQIYVKINRALTSKYEEADDGDLWDDIPKDSDGSAKVALQGIDSSIGGWNYLLNNLEKEKESIKPFVRMLLWLKMEVEKEFPEARNFVWPPKED